MVTSVILQAVSQPAAHRIMLYASSPHLQVFSSRQKVCAHAQELGLGTSDFKGPGLVLLENCQATPKELLKHLMGCFLRGYIVRIYWCHFVCVNKGHLVLHLNMLLQALMNDELHDVEESESESNGQTETVSNIKGNVKVRLQTFPRALATWLIDELPNIDFVVHGFSHSLYAVETDGVIRYGIGTGEDMYLMPSDKEALFKGYVARACSKLEEALHVKGFNLRHDMFVMDVGAAPGAWTEFLSERVCHVVAIDPGKLDNNILGKGVTHICRKAQDATRELMLWTRGRSFDLLVCDINKHPVEAAAVVLPLLKFLKPGSPIIMTLKFHGRGKEKVKKVSELKDIFKDTLAEMECIWLLANSIYERTFVGIKR